MKFPTWHDDPDKIVCPECSQIMTRDEIPALIREYGSKKILKRYTKVVATLDKGEPKQEAAVAVGNIIGNEMKHLTQICAGPNCTGEELHYKDGNACTHMTCLECNYEYCWLCNEDYHGHKYSGSPGSDSVCNTHGERYPMFAPDMNTPWDGLKEWRNIIGDEVEVKHKGTWYNARIYPKIKQGYFNATQWHERCYNVETDDRDGTKKIIIPNCRASNIRLRLRQGSNSSREGIRHFSTPWRNTTVIAKGEGFDYWTTGKSQNITNPEDYYISWDTAYGNNQIMFQSKATGDFIRWYNKKRQWYIQSGDNTVFEPFAGRRRLQEKCGVCEQAPLWSHTNKCDRCGKDFCGLCRNEKADIWLSICKQCNAIRDTVR